MRPAEETGTGRPRVEAVYGYVVRAPDGVLLLDTGLGEADDYTVPALVDFAHDAAVWCP